MKAKRFYPTLRASCLFLAAMLLVLPETRSLAMDKINLIYTARVMSQAYPWIAEEAGLFKKYDLDVPVVFVTPGAPSVAAILSGDSEVAVIGAASISRPFVQGNKDPVVIGGVKSLLTHSILAKADIKSPDQLKGKRIGVSRIGSNPHYFAVQALRHFGIDSREVSYIQAGGAPETLAALVAQGIDAAVLTVPTDAQALKLGYHYVIYGPDLKIAYAATTLTTRRSIIAKRGPVIGRFMRAMAEAAKIMHVDKEQTFKILGKYLRIDDRKLLEASYNVEIKALEPRLALKPEGIQSTLDEIAPTDPRAKSVKPQEMIDLRYLDEMEKGGFMEQLWSGKR
ncbi:MAG TPA: ABC transporter substrate-binding protein [Candidatus Saccharimonadales bacterium]|nr:ABC transporter substrate-binding protein [Candidatus Saccharimonadales bacterium]